MSQRLQVLMDERELRELRRTARRHGMTVAAWVRQVLRAAVRSEPTTDAARKLEVIRAAAGHAFPVADIDASAWIGSCRSIAASTACLA